MRRPEQLAELIREEVSQIVGYELDDPRVETVVVTDVRVSENLRDASVYVTAEGTEGEKTAAMKALQHAAPYVRRQLSILLNLKYTPELHFVRDTVEESAVRVDELLSEIEKEKRDRPGDQEEAGEERKDEG
ncbi:MAG: 30S ribosome-binding factor RbfA [Acidobacteriota bacterium]|nr:30S ribosome-binding factor RbfA [Acidobacteriota bacterium]MDQ5839085.1 30S ribosome-binding factor RbfA [Acidobacteriota bacterium]